MTKWNFLIILYLLFRNFIPHETIKCSSKDQSWMSKEIISALRRKNRVYKKYNSGGRKQEDESNLQKMTIYVSNLITTSKNSCFANFGEKLNNSGTSAKTYWSILKRLNKIKIPGNKMAIDSSSW